MIEKILVAMVALAALCGCNSARYVPVETVRDRWHTAFVTDTVEIHDSTVIDRAGDTVRELRWRDRWRVSIVRDTVCSADTIREPYPVEVPAKLTPWERMKVNIGGWAIAATVIYILMLIVRIIVRMKF